MYYQDYDKMKHVLLAIPLVMFFLTSYAQEPAKYRITYDCVAQTVTGKSNTFRWTLDK